MKTGGPADVHFAVWGDVSATRSSNESQRGAAVANGYVQTTEGIRVPYRCEVGGDGTARMTIGGRSYDVKDGALFLISTRGVTAPSSKPLVRQVAVDLTRLPNESDELIAYAKEHGEIERFFTDAADGDKADDPPR